MLVSCETGIKTIADRIREMKDIETTVKERKKQMEKSVELLDGIIADGAISDTHLRMLVDEIVIYEKNGKLDIQIKNALMKHFYSIYDYSIQVTMGLVCRNAVCHGLYSDKELQTAQSLAVWWFSLHICCMYSTKLKERLLSQTKLQDKKITS